MKYSTWAVFTGPAIALFAAVGASVNVTALALIVAGAVLGFLRYNTHPARVFMGDSGSQMLGFCVGTLALLATQGETSPVSAVLPLLLLGLPIMDTLTEPSKMLRSCLISRTPLGLSCASTTVARVPAAHVSFHGCAGGPAAITASVPASLLRHGPG